MIRRGNNIQQGIKKIATNDPLPKRRHGPRPALVQVPGQSNSETFLKKRAAAAVQLQGSGISGGGVSEFRQSDLIRATETFGAGSELPTPLLVYSNSYKKAQEIKRQYGFDKTAATTTITTIRSWCPPSHLLPRSATAGWSRGRATPGCEPAASQATPRAVTRRHAARGDGRRPAVSAPARRAVALAAHRVAARAAEATPAAAPRVEPPGPVTNSQPGALAKSPGSESRSPRASRW